MGLNSETLQGKEPRPASPRGHQVFQQSSKGDAMGKMLPDDEEDLDPNARRQLDLSSELFGRETPIVSAEELHNLDKRITPSDFKWFNAPVGINSAGGSEVTHKDRSYREKCSNLFDHQSPDAHVPGEAQMQEREDESHIEAK